VFRGFGYIGPLRPAELKWYTAPVAAGGQIPVIIEEFMANCRHSWVLLSMLFSAPAWAGFALMPVVGPAGPDLTANFRAYFSSPAEVPRARLLPYKILFIPGFNADYIEDTIGYFNDARGALLDLGLSENSDFELVFGQEGFSGEQSVAENSRALERILLASDRPVLAITHSKAAVDFLETLIRSPVARAKVKGWVSWQGANGGSILADVVSRGWTRPVMKAVLGVYGGNIDALDDLRQAMRVTYLREHLAEIETIEAAIPTLSLITQQDHGRLTAPLRAITYWFDPNYEKSESDGMVGIANAFLPYSPFVFLEGVSHEDTAEQGSFDRVRLLHTSLALVLARMAH
jgi:hypothetical protein